MKKLVFLFTFALISQELFAQTEANFRRNLKKDPTDIQSYVGLIEITSSRDVLTKIESEAVANIGERSAIYTALGNAYMRIKDYNNAVTAYRRAVSLNPKSALSYNRLGIALLNISYYRQAEVAFKSALALSTNPASNSSYNTYIAIALENVQEYTQAKEFIDAALKINLSYAPALEVQNRLRTKAPNLF